jgi:hypothetical protein
MAVATRVIGNAILIALLAVQSVTAERIGSAAPDGRHNLELVQGDAPGMRLTPGIAVALNNVRHLK